MAKWKECSIEAQLANARAEGYAQGVRDAAHTMPRHFGVWSSTGVHIGVWEDGKIAAEVLAEYPGGVMRDLIDMDAILAILDTPAPPSPEAVARAALEWAEQTAVMVANDMDSDREHTGAMYVLDALRVDAADPGTLAQIIAQAGKGAGND
jgi:hypothetical protein